MADEQVLLEPSSLAGRDEVRREVAEPGRDAVHRLTALDQLLDDAPAGGHAVARRLVERDGHAVPSDRLHGFERQPVAVEQETCRRRRAPCARPCPGRSRARWTEQLDECRDPHRGHQAAEHHEDERRHVRKPASPC
jgi:hypothetical protein